MAVVTEGLQTFILMRIRVPRITLKRILLGQGRRLVLLDNKNHI